MAVDVDMGMDVNHQRAVLRRLTVSSHGGNSRENGDVDYDGNSERTAERLSECGSGRSSELSSGRSSLELSSGRSSSELSPING